MAQQIPHIELKTKLQSITRKIDTFSIDQFLQHCEDVGIDTSYHLTKRAVLHWVYTNFHMQCTKREKPLPDQRDTAAQDELLFDMPYSFRPSYFINKAYARGIKRTPKALQNYVDIRCGVIWVNGKKHYINPRFKDLAHVLHIDVNSPNGLDILNAKSLLIINNIQD